MAGLYNGHLLEFPQIRVDCFTTPSLSRPHLLPPADPSSSTAPWVPAPNARLYLLTHVHTDHLVGLSNAFTGKILCSPDTKRMLLRLEAEVERERVDGGLREGKVLKYEGLKARIVGEGKASRKVDMIEAIPYGDPREYELGYENGEPYKVTITLLDANHCPGSTMYVFVLISPEETTAVLHTGDVRADHTFIQQLRVNPAVAEFIEPLTSYPHAPSGQPWGRRVLDRIYLDTSAVLGTGDMPDREQVLADLVEQMSMYPGDTVFFLNVWCFGWEHVVKAVARHFREPVSPDLYSMECPHHTRSTVHVDRYKRSIYDAVKTDPFLLSCTTSDALATRFHACERRMKCDGCRTFDMTGKRTWNTDKRIVHVNMVEVKSATWDIQQTEFRDKLGRAACGEAEWPYNIQCPIARHSPLPELKSLVAVFRPRAVSPNCVVPSLIGLDYFLLPHFLEGLLQSGGTQLGVVERDAWFRSPICFVRDGTACLANMIHQQQLGLDMLRALEANDESDDIRSKYDDYLPTQMSNDPKSMILGGTRRHIAYDQALKAGVMIATGALLPAYDVTPPLAVKRESMDVKPKSSSQTHDPELSETDNEEQSECRRRSAHGPGKRKHLVSPSIARGRVLSLSKLNNTNKRIKSEPNSACGKLPNLAATSPDQFPELIDPSELRPTLNAEAHEASVTEASVRRLQRSRYLVDRGHLVALMAVGEVPPSPS